MNTAVNDQSGRVALVTGAARGIGLETVRQLATQGFTTVLTGRDMAAGLTAVDLLAQDGLRVQFIPLDVQQDSSVQSAVRQVSELFGRLDVLVNNAAAFVDWSASVTTTTMAAAQNVMETNLFGPWRVTLAFLPLLRTSEHPRIVNVSSGAGSHGDQQFGLTTSGGGVAAYSVSKAALNALTVKLAAELAQDHILVNAVCPGLTATAPGMEEMGAQPVAEGAKGIVWAATLPDDGPTGGFFRHGQPLPW